MGNKVPLFSHARHINHKKYAVKGHGGYSACAIKCQVSCSVCAIKGHGGYSACGKRSWRLFRMSGKPAKPWVTTVTTVTTVDDSDSYDGYDS
jgi:hypothetical protein